MFCAVKETTGQVLAEQQLIEERERQKLMLQQMPGFVSLLFGAEHRYEYVNDAYREISGDRELVGLTVRKAFPELAGQGFYELLDQVYTTGEAFVARTMPIRLDRGDHERFLDFIYQPVHERGIVNGIFVGGYDVTERVQIERALRDGEIQLRKLNETLERRVSEAVAERKILADIVDGTDAFVQVADPEFRWLAINQAAIREFQRILDPSPRLGNRCLRP
jgi:PAS domain S-box-containing protein